MPLPPDMESVPKHRLLACGNLVMDGAWIYDYVRKKIDPKTVVTAQNAIQRVIIALILITFSYAIVGASYRRDEYRPLL